MPENPQDAAAGYIDAVKWLVGISGAVMAGVFLHPEEAVNLQQDARYCLGAVMLLFGISSFGGVVYLLWLTNIRRKKELFAQVETKLAAPVVIPNVQEIETLKTKRDRLKCEMARAQKRMDWWYLLFTVAFYLGAIVGVLFFLLRIVRAKAPVAIEPMRYSLVQSAVHRTDHGMQAHTFLLNQQTGQMWQMICDQKGMVVAFRRVKRLDLDGNLEPDTPKEIDEAR